MKKRKLVMVGNGMAGVRTLEELLKLAPDMYDITVFGAEPHPNYNRILLSPVLAGEQTVDEIVLNALDWYSDNGITLHVGKKVAKIDRVSALCRAPRTAPAATTTACCSPPAPILSSCRFPAPICLASISFRDIADVDAMIRRVQPVPARGRHRRRPAGSGSGQRPDDARHAGDRSCTSRRG
ncbi:MAG: hypothetical protein MZW92_14795 [Comamonadaceae bacterium]|nr:hypothetical protein [Comamonadaceae bacterium]